MPVVRDRKIRIALRTNQIAGFVTVPSKKKISILFVPEWNQESKLRVIHGSCERFMLEVIGDPINPGGLANPHLSQYENVDVLLL